MAHYIVRIPGVRESCHAMASATEPRSLFRGLWSRHIAAGRPPVRQFLRPLACAYFGYWLSHDNREHLQKSLPSDEPRCHIWGESFLARKTMYRADGFEHL